ncbi:helix-turn-helix domain-containing protein [Leifsonia sp. NPDC058248]|uniref:helix-turn-helix domain-containing protein n=1 Tax=Leifsonia sp. NPDC058248 TaxID=3346402 RepID=UPI0036DF6308
MSTTTKEAVAEPGLNLTVKEAAVSLRVSDQTIRAAIHNGDLAAKKVGRRYVIPVEAARDYRDNLPDA